MIRFTLPTRVRACVSCSLRSFSFLLSDVYIQQGSSRRYSAADSKTTSSESGLCGRPSEQGDCFLIFLRMISIFCLCNSQIANKVESAVEELMILDELYTWDGVGPEVYGEISPVWLRLKPPRPGMLKKKSKKKKQQTTSSSALAFQPRSQSQEELLAKLAVYQKRNNDEDKRRKRQSASSSSSCSSSSSSSSSSASSNGGFSAQRSSSADLLLQQYAHVFKESLEVKQKEDEREMKETMQFQQAVLASLPSSSSNANKRKQIQADELLARQMAAEEPKLKRGRFD